MSKRRLKGISVRFTGSLQLDSNLITTEFTEKQPEATEEKNSVTRSQLSSPAFPLCLCGAIARSILMLSIAHFAVPLIPNP